MQRETPTSVDLRRWAMQCGARASSAGCSADERERLLRMREALLDLADTEDWLSGMMRGQGAAVRSAERDDGSAALSRTG